MHISGESLEALKVVETKKGVTFSPETVSHEREFVPYKKMKQQPNFSRMQKIFLTYLNTGQYESIESYLSGYASQTIENFYKEKGGVFLRWALIDAPSVEPLVFLVKNIPENITRDLLSVCNFSSLHGFLYAQKAREEVGSLTQERRKLAAQKINILLNINDVEIHRFVDNNVTDNMRENLKNIESATLAL
ncbi:MAG: hypothetical protein KBD23_00635 [Gammaproteobacteria bacterium]|nr:hypothetical protein [Gammaproteobacteria bacterium]